MTPTGSRNRANIGVVEFEDDPKDVDTWFATQGLRLDVHEVDVTGMVRIQPDGDEPPRYQLTLIGADGHVNRPAYASGDRLDEAKRQARERYLQELAVPPSTALGWAEAVIEVPVGDGAWTPMVELRNLTHRTITVSGPMMATGQLLRPDGSRVTSRQPQPWPMPAALKGYRLPPGQSAQIAVALSLMPDEKAALSPGTYRLTEVWWGEMNAPEIDVEIRAAL
jgi:hypothetical protein